MKEEEARKILKSTGWLARERADFREAVLANCRLKAFRSGEYVFHIQDDLGGLFGVADGGFGVYVPSAGDKLLLSEILRQGVWFGTGPVLSGRPRVLTFRAVEPSHALHIPLSVLNRLTSDNPAFKGRLGALSDQNFASPIQIIGDLLISSGEQRIAATLLRISRSHYDPPDKYPWTIRLSQSDIAEMSNASRDLVNRVLAKLERNHWINVEYKEIQILDGKSLHRFAYGREPG